MCTSDLYVVVFVYTRINAPVVNGSIAITIITGQLYLYNTYYSFFF